MSAELLELTLSYFFLHFHTNPVCITTVNDNDEVLIVTSKIIFFYLLLKTKEITHTSVIIANENG